jgi:hypothetical protein
VPQVFHRSFNTISKVTILGSVFILAALGGLLAIVVRSSYATSVDLTREQPVPFSHEHHVSGLGIDCRYCHTSVEVSGYPGMPPTKTCINCHQQIWVGSEMLAPVRESYRAGRPIQWSKVHRLSEFVYYNHSVHVNKGFSCATCHGPIQNMPLTWQHGTLLMEWCLDCHREPERYIRPKGQVFNMDWKPEDEGPDVTQATLGPKLVERYGVAKNLISCSTCHR